jgi:hypothetical protein
MMRLMALAEPSANYMSMTISSSNFLALAGEVFFSVKGRIRVVESTEKLSSDSSFRPQGM